MTLQAPWIKSLFSLWILFSHLDVKMIESCNAISFFQTAIWRPRTRINANTHYLQKRWNFEGLSILRFVWKLRAQPYSYYEPIASVCSRWKLQLYCFVPSDQFLMMTFNVHLINDWWKWMNLFSCVCKFSRCKVKTLCVIVASLWNGVGCSHYSVEYFM